MQNDLTMRDATLEELKSTQDYIKSISYGYPRWIPVVERLPEEFEYVLCSTDAREVFMANYLGKMDDGTDCFFDDNGMMWEGDVITWIPLPEPYTEVEND